VDLSSGEEEVGHLGTVSLQDPVVVEVVEVSSPLASHLAEPVPGVAAGFVGHQLVALAAVVVVVVRHQPSPPVVILAGRSSDH